MSKILLIIGIIVVIFFGLGWVFNRSAFPKPSLSRSISHQQSQTSITTGSSSATINSSPDLCDVSLWQRVAHRRSLKILDQCKTVTGIIEDARQSPGDGDLHIQLKLDSQYSNLINSQNISQQKRTLVLEAICVFQPEEQDAITACSGYANTLKIPPIGTHVRVTGSYVLDQEWGWMEIHPISQIKLL